MRKTYRSILRGDGVQSGYPGDSLEWCTIVWNGMVYLIKIGLNGNLKLIKFPENFHFDICISPNISRLLCCVFCICMLSWPINWLIPSCLTEFANS